MTDRTILVVGGGVAGGTAARALREEGFDGPLVLVTAEQHAPYERPPVSKGLLVGEVGPDATDVEEPSWWTEHDVELVLGRTVTSLDLEAGTATLDGADAATLSWDDLVLATGATASPSPVPGSDLPGAFTLRTIEDSLALRDALAAATSVVVVGASWIGLEAAAAARAHDCEVTVVGREDEPLQAVLGREVGAAYRRLHEDQGVTFRTGVGVERVTGEDRASGVLLEGGEQLDADVVVLGTGVRPVTDIAEAAGLELDDELGGVRVDSQLRSSHPRVSVIGDVAAHDHPRLGRLRVEHVEVARGHGSTVARVLMGGDDVHDELPLFYSDQYDLGMEYVGHADPDDVVVRGELPASPFVAFYLDDDDVVRAGTHADEWDATEVIRELVGRRVDRAVLADPDVALDELAARAPLD